MSYLFDPPAAVSLPVAGTTRRFPVHRIYCVGRNYSAHVREMGGEPERERPFFFLKPTDAVVTPGRIPAYPPGTNNLHHEVELVVAIGRAASAIAANDAAQIVCGYAVGNDLTRRDLQLAARNSGRPWDFGKAFDESAPVSAIHPCSAVGHPSRGAIWLNVNGVLRQRADLKEMIWAVPEIIAELSRYYALVPGDLIFTGTPDGVGPLLPGDLVEAGIEGVDTLIHRVGPTVVRTASA